MLDDIGPYIANLMANSQPAGLGYSLVRTANIEELLQKMRELGYDPNQPAAVLAMNRREYPTPCFDPSEL